MQTLFADTASNLGYEINIYLFYDMIMPELQIRFDESFGVFNRKLSDGGSIAYPLNRRASIKDIVESLGVPHTEVGWISVGGTPVDFRFVPVRSAVIAIDPVHPPFEVTRASILRPQPLESIRFVADVNVGKLALLMRVVGLDTVYGNSTRDADIASMAENEGRIVLSKDIGLLKRSQIIFGRYVRAVRPNGQLKEVVDYFGLRGAFKAFSRCVRCNAELIHIEKKDVIHRLEPKTRKYFHRFKTCPVCDRIFWRGSHHDHLKRRMATMGIPIKD